MEDLNTEEKFDNIEAKLLEQEHRLFPVWVNFFSKGKYTKGDKRRTAINKALIWSLIPKPTPTILAISALSILTAFFAYEANVKLENQNTLLLIQNELQESQRRASLNIEISSIMQQINNEREAKRLKSLKDSTHRLRGHKVSPYVLSDITSARIASISRSLRPYRILKTDRIDLNEFKVTNFLENDFTFIKTKSIKVGDFLEENVRSPEREQLLAALFTMRISFSNIGQYSNFDYCFFEDLDFSNGDLRTIRLSNSSLKKCNLSYTIFDEGQLINTNFSNTNGVSLSFISSNLEHSNFTDAVIFGTNFSESNLNDVNFMKSGLIQCNFSNAIITNANLTAANLSGANLTEVDFTGSDLSYANLSLTDFKNIKGIKDVKSFKNTLISDLYNCPDDIIQYMIAKGAIQNEKDYADKLEVWEKTKS